MKQLKCPSVDEWIKKMWCIYIQFHKKEWTLASCNNMDGPRVYYAKWNKSEKHKYCMISLICGK